MNETLRRLQKARQAGEIARGFGILAHQQPTATLTVSYSWRAIETLAKRLELTPDTLATMLVNESVSCNVATESPLLPAAASRMRRTAR